MKNLSRNDSAQIYMDYDRDTMGRSGSPDISEVIFDKIEKSILFIGDVSIVTGGESTRKSPNPNVLIELGFAAKQLGWERIICLFNENTGNIEDLPFDLRQKRILAYNPELPDEKKRVTAILEFNIKVLFSEGKLFNPLNDYMKGRIDRSLLDVCKQLSNMIFGTVSMSEGLAHTPDYLSMTLEMVKKHLEYAEILGFIVLNNYQGVAENLQQILKELLSSNYFPREWTYTVLEAIDWIRSYAFLISCKTPNCALNQIKGKECDDYAAILGTAINKDNAPNTYLILEVTKGKDKKYIDPQAGRVVNCTQYLIDRTAMPDPFKQYYSFKSQSIESTAELFIRWSNICKRWLDNTGSEFILDPDRYYIY